MKNLVNKFNVTIINLVLCFVILLIWGCLQQEVTSSTVVYEKMVSDFKVPAEDNHLWCYWYWIDDDISKEGITKDLTAMKHAGIGTAFIGNINPHEIDGKVPLFSDLWWECMVHAVNEGKRLNVDIGVFNCPGWSQSGGPWVKSEMAMRYLSYSETTVKGPGKVSKKLVQPQKKFQDVCVLAYPALELLQVLTKDNAVINVIPEVKNSENWIDGDLTSAAAFDSTVAKTYEIIIKAAAPITARSIMLYPGSQQLNCECKLFVRIDGNDKLVKSFMYDRSNHDISVGPIPTGPVSISLPETRSSEFKLVCYNIHGTTPGFSEIRISEKPVLESYIEKQLGKMHPTPLPMWGSYLWDQQPPVSENLILPAENVIDISDKMDKDGNLTWDVSEGEWIVMRIGTSPTGTKNAPAAPQGKGYEIDKASEELIRYHFKYYVGKLLEKIPPQNRDALKYVIMDSYEMGSQNWTDEFEKRFEKRYGYNPKKWLPVLSGVIVNSLTESERFLWDLRRAVADDVAYEYVGGLRKISNQHGLQTWLENYGHWGFPSEFLMYGGQSDLVGGEFWNEGTLGDIECKAASSCVHTYGKNRCFAEAFTCAREIYKRHPAMLKTRGDRCFTEGVNQYVLHLYIQQPDDNRVPGVNAWFGTELNRHNTWFKQSKHWMDYARRCQHLLQQGAYVADVCYFISENAPKVTGVRIPELPAGYSYDYINAELILRDMQVKNGKLALSGGPAYSLMVLPPLDTMRPEVAAKIERLVNQGGSIYGPKPLRSPSMENYPQCDRQVQEIAERIWDESYRGGKLSREYGKGRVFNEMNLEDVLNTLKVQKDFVLDHDSVLWTHRTKPGMDIYFISNQSDKKIDIQPQFRVTGLKPQLWDAISGDIRTLNEFTQTQQGTIIPLTLEPRQSLFVVFTNEVNQEVKDSYKVNFPVRKTLTKIQGIWNVEFDNPIIDVHRTERFKDLIDWSDSNDEEIKYYSGTVVYTIEFTLDAIPENQDIFINLGQVNNMAEVTVNGKFAGGAWIYPYVLNVTNSVKPGKNTLQVEVVNLWRNYLVKEHGLPQDQRKTWLVSSDVNKDEQLQPSGLIGPVVIETTEILLNN